MIQESSSAESNVTVTELELPKKKRTVDHNALKVEKHKKQLFIVLFSIMSLEFDKFCDRYLYFILTSHYYLLWVVTPMDLRPIN